MKVPEVALCSIDNALGSCESRALQLWLGGRAICAWLMVGFEDHHSAAAQVVISAVNAVLRMPYVQHI